MYNVTVNYEKPNCVILNFEEMIEAYSDSLEYCEEIISSFERTFSHLKNSIDEPQDYYYIITCDSEEEASEVESYLDESFSNLEEKLEYELEDSYEY